MPGVVETTNTFATNQVITSTALNNIIDQTLFTSDALSGNTLALVAGKMKVATSGITSNEMGTNAVTANAIADGVITNAKINASAAIDLSKLATGALPTAITIASANIVDGTIVAGDIASAAITAPKLDGAQTGTAPIFGVRSAGTFLFQSSSRTLNANSLNAASVTRINSTSTSVTFTTALPNANYSVVATYNDNTEYTSVIRAFNKTTAGFSLDHQTEGTGRTMGFIVVG